MKQKQKFYQYFILCFLISLILILISPTKPVKTLSGLIDKFFAPLQKSIYSNLGIKYTNENQELKELKNKNRELNTQILKLKTVEEDLSVLKSQLMIANPPLSKLKMANIIGSDMNHPGDIPTEFLIDLGKKQGITKKSAVVYKNIIIGLIDKIADNRSSVLLINNKKLTFTARTLKTNAIGVISGSPESINFAQVLLTDKLEKEDIVVTKGDINLDGSGIVPGLIVGKINTIDKKPSALFQSADITPLVDAAKLNNVFVIFD